MSLICTGYKIIQAALAFAALGIVLEVSSVSAAEIVITPGIDVAIDYTCRLEGGEVVGSTSSEVARTRLKENPYAVFVANRAPGSVVLKSGSASECGDCKANAEKYEFERVLNAKLAAAIVGRTLGKGFKVNIAAQAAEDLKNEERFIQLARVTRLPKKIRTAREYFYRQTGLPDGGVPPAAGQAVDIYTELAGKIVLVNDTEIAAEFVPRSSAPVRGPFGMITVHDRGDHYESEVMVKEGDLVSAGPLLGRVAKVEDSMFTLDFGHPFGGQTLTCEVETRKPETAKLSQSKGGN